MGKHILNVIKTLAVMYIFTGIILLVMALVLYRFNLSDWQVTAGIIATYALSSFAGGYVLAKKGKTRRLLWGMLFGLVYFAVLAAASIAMNKGIVMDQAAAIRAFLICIGAGAAGAFIVPVQQ